MEKLPFEFTTAADLLKLCKKHKMSISEIALRYEMAYSQHSREDVYQKMKKTAAVMKSAVHNGIFKPEKSAFKMAGGDAEKIHKAYKSNRKMLLNRLALRAATYATATGETNSAMGRIAAFPTAGGSGVVPGALLALSKEWKLSERRLIHGMFTASAVGMLIAKKATLSAAAGGCQAEVGAATAMAAAGVTEMRGGSPEDCLNASAIALKSYLGLACDPLGGLVAVPCIKRNTLGAVTALTASDLTMAGVKTFIPLDEVIFAMDNIGRIMSEKIRETALGGLAVTPTGLAIRKKLGLPDLKPQDID